MAVGKGGTAPLIKAAKQPAADQRPLKRHRPSQPPSVIERPWQRGDVEGKRIAVDALGMLPHRAHTDAEFFQSSRDPAE
jgi:hypothetical protein